MNTAYIIHRWEGTPQDDWYPWLRDRLVEQGWQVIIPSMPNTQAPQIDDWVGTLHKLVSSPDGNTVFIGHSIGCQTILRYLETLPSNTQVGPVHLAAPWMKLENLADARSKAIAQPWQTKPMEWQEIRPKAQKFVAYFSTDDPWVVPENTEIFQINLNAEIIQLPGRGHITDPTFPELVSKLI